MQETVGLFCRISPAVREILGEALRGMNACRKPGEPGMSLGALVERCIVEALTGAPPVLAEAHPEVARFVAESEQAARVGRLARKRRRK